MSKPCMEAVQKEQDGFLANITYIVPKTAAYETEKQHHLLNTDIPLIQNYTCKYQ